MRKLILDFALTHLIKQEFMKDYRLYFAGAGSIATGLGTLAYVIASGDYDKEKVGFGLAALIAGYQMLGDAGKKDKLIAAQNAAVKIDAEKVDVEVK